VGISGNSMACATAWNAVGAVQARGAGWKSRFRGPRPLSGEGAVDAGVPPQTMNRGVDKLQHPRGARPAGARDSGPGARAARGDRRLRIRAPAGRAHPSAGVSRTSRSCTARVTASRRYVSSATRWGARLAYDHRAACRSGAPFPGSLPELIDRHPPVPVCRPAGRRLRDRRRSGSSST